MKKKMITVIMASVMVLIMLTGIPTKACAEEIDEREVKGIDFDIMADEVKILSMYCYYAGNAESLTLELKLLGDGRWLKEGEDYTVSDEIEYINGNPYFLVSGCGNNVGDRYISASYFPIIEAEEWRFFVNDKYLQVIDYLGSDEDVVIPESVIIDNEEYEVVFVLGCIFAGCENLRYVDFGNLTFQEYSFVDCPNLSHVRSNRREGHNVQYLLGGECSDSLTIEAPTDTTFYWHTEDGEMFVKSVQDFCELRGYEFKAIEQGHEHTYATEWTIDVEPTCAEEGSKSRHCTDSNCTEKTDTKEIPATGLHIYNDGKDTKEATCAQEGEKTYTCKVCGETKTESVAATGLHTYDEWVETKAATLEKAGAKTRTCTVCGHEQMEEIPAIGHVKGVRFTKGGNIYSIRTVKGRKGTVVYVGAQKQTTSIKIPKTVKIGGKTYTVTEIGKGAFKNNNELKNVTIPEGVTTIGKSAFEDCKNLKKITIKTTKLKGVGKNAIKGIHKKAIIRVPKKQLKKYKKLFKGKTGYKKTMKIKK